MSDSESLDDLIDSTVSSLFDWVLKISLFIGAIFQLVCIFAVILLPSRTSDNVRTSQPSSIMFVFSYCVDQQSPKCDSVCIVCYAAGVIRSVDSKEGKI